MAPPPPDSPLPILTRAACARPVRRPARPPRQDRLIDARSGWNSSSECDLLHAPVRHLANQQVAFRPAIDRIDHAELFRQLAGSSELAEYPAVELELVDFAIVERLGIVGVRAI